MLAFLQVVGTDFLEPANGGKPIFDPLIIIYSVKDFVVDHVPQLELGIFQKLELVITVM